MWREFIESFGLVCFFGAPATPREIDQLEMKLGLRLPSELHKLLAEANGITFEPRFTGEPSVSKLAVEEGWVLDLIWSTAEIAEENGLFRSWEQGVAPPLHQLIFFGAQPNGDPVALRNDLGEDQRNEVVVMSHEDSTHRRVMSPSLREYLITFLQACQ